MREFELLIAVAELTPGQEDAIYDRWDALIASHGRSTRLVITANGTSAVEAAQATLAALGDLGVRPRRLVEDLVTRGDIAERASVSRQGVGLWVRGERQQQAPFPEAYANAAGGLWLWGDVADWLRNQGKHFEGDDLAYPTADDHARVNALLAESRELARMT